ncbi:hypothetical protein Tco_0160087, partial [Tanacetum coccineum]
AGSRNRPTSVPAGRPFPADSRNRPTSVPAGSRNRPTFVPDGRPFPADSRNRPTSVPAGRPFPSARPMTRPKSNYFQQFSWPGSYNQMDMDGGRWGTAVKTSTDKECLVLSKEFQLPDSSQVVLRVPRRHNLYCFNLTDDSSN